MIEWIDILPWIPIVTSAVAGYFCGRLYAECRWCRACLGAVLFIIMKLDKRGVYLSPYDRAVIRTAIIHVATTE